MKRHFLEYLIEWKNRANKKPMIIRGARQVGKTYIINQFGVENYDTFLKINFEEKPDFKNIFNTNIV